MSDKNSHQRPWRTLVTTVAAAGVLGLAGCTDEDTQNSPDNFTKNSPEDIAQESKSDYNDNTNGLITGSTLQEWIDDWEDNRPSGITGDLVIMHVSTEEDGSGDPVYIEPKPTEGVRSYALDVTSRLTETRSNGVVTNKRMVPSASKMDEFLADFDIDPTEDMIVWTMGAGGGGQAMQQGRGWYAMRYWGTEKEHLALLNGGADWDENEDANDYVIHSDYKGDSVNCDVLNDEDTSCLPDSGTVTARDLPEDNTAMLATLDDVMDAVQGKTDAFIWDARSYGEYEGDSYSSGGMQGHPKGAVVLPFGNLLMDDGSNRYKTKDDLAAYVAGDDVEGDDEQFHYLDYDADSLMKVKGNNDGLLYEDGQTSITYCETTYRAMITGVASAVVLGMPNRFYDGAMTQWNHMVYNQTEEGDYVLPHDSPWRTDKSELSYFNAETAGEFSVDGEFAVDDAYGANTNEIVETDRAYKISGAGGDDDSSSDDGGGAPAANPCGG